MSNFENDNSGREEPPIPQPPAAPNTVEALRPSSAALGKTVVIGVLLALAGAWVASTIADRLRVVENVDHGIKAQYMFGGTRLNIGRATHNAVVAYAIVGAILSLILGVAAGCLLGRFSMPRVLVAGLGGVVLGACLGAASSYGLTPVYFHRMETADITLTLLIHLGIWTAVGAASGVAFGVGSGSRDAPIRFLVGGIVGAAVGTLLYDIAGAFLPLAHTERPLSEEAGTRLAANIVLCLCVTIGIVIVALQEPRGKSPKVFAR